MKKIITAALLFICAVAAAAQTIPQTPFLHLNKPPHGYQPYDVPVDANFDILDSWAQTITNSLQQQFKGAWSAGTSYSQGQSVTLSGDYYISLTNMNAANTPTHTSMVWAWVGTTNASGTTLPTGIPFTVSVGGVLTTATMTVENFDTVWGTTPTSDLCWLDNTGACSIPPTGYTPPNGVPFRDPSTGTSATVTAAQLAASFMVVNSATPCTDGIIQADGNCYPMQALQDITADANGKPTTLGERGVSCSGSEPQTCTVAWAEDQSQGLFDPRRPRTFDNGGGSPVTLATDCAASIVNTINAAVCAAQANPNISPIIKLPAGHYSGCGKGTQLPPGITLIGQPGAGAGDYGGATFLQSGDATQAMYVEVTNYTATCGGSPVTVGPGGGQRFEHISLNGNGSANQNDVGMIDNSTGGTYLYDASFANFGGPGVQITSLNSHGDKVFGFANLGWYYFGGTYNNGAFTDTNWHAGLELGGQDGQWDHVVQYGYLQDSGWYNRWYLVGVLSSGGPSSRLEDSFIQINPHNVVGAANSDNGRRIHHNRLDDSWFDSVRTQFFGGGNIGDNDITGFCTSPLLNPANFGTNPVPGTSPDPNCSGIYMEDGGNSRVYWNNIGEAPGDWPSWPSYQVYQEPNNTGQTGVSVGIVEQPGDSLGGYFGSNWCCGNQGADGSRSIIYTTVGHPIAGGVTNGTIALGPNVGTNWVSTTTPSTWNNITAQYGDFIARIFIGSLDTIVPSATVKTCGNQILTGSDTGLFKGGSSGYEFWMRDPNDAVQINCPVGPAAPAFSNTDPVDTACTTSSPSIVYGLGFANGCNTTFHIYLPLYKQDFLITRFDEFPSSTDIQHTLPFFSQAGSVAAWTYGSLGSGTDAWEFQSGGGIQYTGSISTAGDDVVFIAAAPGSNYAIRATFASTGQAGEVILRYTDDNNFVAFRVDASGIPTLVSVHAGTVTTLYTGSTAFPSGPMGIQIAGQIVNGSYSPAGSSGPIVFSGTIPTGVNTASNKVGLGVWTTSNNTFKVNNFALSNE